MEKIQNFKSRRKKCREERKRMDQEQRIPFEVEGKFDNFQSNELDCE